MPVNFYILLLILFCIYFYIRESSIKFEIIFLFLLIYFGPEVLYKDLPNYIVDINRVLPFIKKSYLDHILKFAYPLCYILCYYLLSKNIKGKESRLAFITMTIATLGYNQLYLCFALLCFLIQHNLKNKWIRGIFIVWSLFAHLSIIVLYGYYLYKWNKKIAVFLFLIIISIFFINPYFYLGFASLDERIIQYTLLQNNYDNWGVYTFRSQLYFNLNIFIFSIFIKNYRLAFFVILIFIFSMVISHLHAVFVGRGVELLYIVYFVLLMDEKITRKYRVFIITSLTIYFINNMHVAYLS